MRAVMVSRHGGPEVLELADLETPSPGPRQLLVDVAVAGVNFRDVYEREGIAYGGTPPFVAGAEGSGTVAAIGEGVTDFRVGDRVAWSSAQGSYAEQVLVDTAKAVQVPDGVSDEIAAAVLLQGMTAHYLCNDVYPVQDGDTVLVHAGAGGVGLLLTQLVRARGGRVIATVSTDEKAALSRAAGASETIPYEGFAERARDAHRRPGRRGGLRRRGKDHVRRQPREPPRARDARDVRQRERTGRPARHPASDVRRLARTSPDPRCSTSCEPARSSSLARHPCWQRSRTGRSRCASEDAIRWRTRAGRSKTCRAAARRESCSCWCIAIDWNDPGSTSEQEPVDAQDHSRWHGRDGSRRRARRRVDRRRADRRGRVVRRRRRRADRRDRAATSSQG